MNTLIVYDSTYGNTGEIARTLASTLGEYGTVRLVRLSETGSMNTQEVDVLIIGGPTHNRGLSPALRQLFARIPHGTLGGLCAAAFDTRYHLPAWKSGSAATHIARKVKRSGASLLVPPESFFVSGREGPLEDAELKHARAWAVQVAQRFEELALLRV